MSDPESKAYKRAANRIIGVTRIPFPLNDTLIELVKNLMTVDEAKFLSVFRKQSLNISQITKKRPKMTEEEIRQVLESLMDKGVVIGSRSSKGIEVFTLMPIFPGLFEFQLMRGHSTPREKRFVELFEKLFKQLVAGSQSNYDDYVEQVRQIGAIPARVVPAEEQVEVPVEKNVTIQINETAEPKEIVLLPQQASKLIDEADLIAVTHCYCRHEQDLLGNPCKRTAQRENCLVFGKVASHSIKYGFAREISKDHAKEILHDAERDGLVHKIFHTKMDISRDIEGVCSCCPCCCGIFRLYSEGAMPLHTSTFYLAKVVEDDCIGCETCVNACPMNAIEMNDDIARILEERCIGCGVCAKQCQQDAIIINRIGSRDVFVPPKRVQA